jgi:hypothetical protein
MRHSELLNQIRGRVCRAFAAMGVESTDMSETILIRDGHYCGRRFQAEHGHAVWFLEENQIKVYLSDGQVIVLDSEEAAGEGTQRKAA